MPTYDGKCSVCGGKYQFLVKKWSDNNPMCPKDGVELERLACAPNLTGVRSEKFAEHIAVRKNDDGTNTRVLIDSRSKQREFCRHQNLYDPYDQPDKMTFDDRGQPTHGDKINWV